MGKLQNAIYYAIDGDQVNILNILTQKLEEPWVSARVYFYFVKKYNQCL